MKLYKYLAPERVDVLQNFRIRYTQPGAFNDLFETRPGSTKIVHDDEAIRTVDEVWPQQLKQVYDELPPEIRAILPRELVATIAEPYKKALKASAPDLLAHFTPLARRALAQALDTTVGILTLTEKPDNLLMWSHYAASHEGFVIGFDSVHQYFDERKSSEDELRHLRKVEYREQRPSSPLSTLSGVDVFLVKGEEWKYEQEWRIIRPLSDAAETIPATPFPICLFEYPPGALIEVILGARMQKSTRTAVIAALKGHSHFSHVEVFEAMPDEAQSKIVLRRIGA